MIRAFTAELGPERTTLTSFSWTEAFLWPRWLLIDIYREENPKEARVALVVGVLVLGTGVFMLKKLTCAMHLTPPMVWKVPYLSTSVVSMVEDKLYKPTGSPCGLTR